MTEQTVPDTPPAINWAALQDYFHPRDIEWRVQAAGKGSQGIWARVVAYIDARAVQMRLDDVLTPAGWENSFCDLPGGGGIKCGITIHTEHGPRTKFDVADFTHIESLKGGYSSALKRAAVHWGIGRYLHHVEAGFAVIWDGDHRPKESGWYYQPETEKVPGFFWAAPQLPQWALPAALRNNTPTQSPAVTLKGDAIDPVEAARLKRWAPVEQGMRELRKKDPAAYQRVNEHCRTAKLTVMEWLEEIAAVNAELNLASK